MDTRPVVTPGPPIPRPLQDLASDRTGATAVVIGLCMTVLMGFAGLAVDVGLWYADKRAAQGAADSAAYSAAIDYAGGDTVTGAKANAKAVAAQYGFTDGSGGVTVTVNNPPTSGPNTSATGAMEVIITKTESLFFSSFVLHSASVAARSVALSGSSGGKYCVLSLDGGSGTTVSANNGASVDLTACGVQVNGSGSGALSVTGGAQIKATTVSVVGGITMNNGGSITATTKTTGATAVSDPYGSVTTPSPSTCTTQTLPGYGSATLNPGTFCNGLSVANGLQVTMNPGVYIIESSTGFSQQGGTTINATGGVTIVLTGSGSTYATANIANGATLNLTAPSTGATAGLAIMQSRSAPTTGVNNIAGGASLNVVGALYFPKQTVDFSNGTSNGSRCTQLIADDVAFTGGAKFGNTCSGVGTTGIGSGATSLVE